MPKRILLALLVLALCLFVSVTSVSAAQGTVRAMQTPGSPEKATLSGQTSNPDKEGSPDNKGTDPIATKVETPGPPSECKGSKTPCTEFWHTILVTTRNLDQYLSDKKGRSKEPERGDLILFLDGRPLKDIKAFPSSRSAGEDVLRFELEPKPQDENQRAAWVHVIGHAAKPTDNLISVSVGLPESEPIRSQIDGLALQVKPWWESFVWLGMVVLLIGISYLVWKKDLLSDPEKVDGRRPLSLARCQMMWWFLIILLGWAYTATIMRSPFSITNTALILSGISAATALSSLTIDSSRRAQGPQPAKASKFWFYDLISDAQGVSVPRFQMLVWTIVLGVYFASYVWNKMVMPEFDNNLLILMGLSSGTYVTMKIPASQKGTSATS